MTDCHRDENFNLVPRWNKFINVPKDFFFMVQQPPVGQGLLIIEASRSHSDTPHSVGLLWTSDQPDAEASTYTTNIHTISRIRTLNPNSKGAADLRLGQHRHRDWRITCLFHQMPRFIKVYLDSVSISCHISLIVHPRSNDTHT
jgi:hypothetical protein